MSIENFTEEKDMQFSGMNKQEESKYFEMLDKKNRNRKKAQGVYILDVKSIRLARILYPKTVI
jgi:hypothetical protein